MSDEVKSIILHAVKSALPLLRFAASLTQTTIDDNVVAAVERFIAAFEAVQPERMVAALDNATAALDTTSQQA